VLGCICLAANWHKKNDNKLTVPD